MKSHPGRIVPIPQSMTQTTELFVLTSEVKIYAPREFSLPVLRLRDILKTETNTQIDVVYVNKDFADRDDTGRFPRTILFTLSDTVKSDVVKSGEGYVLNITGGHITVDCRSAAGAFHAVSSLRQWILQFGKQLPGLHIEDEPTYENRGLMLDISRDKVPKLDTLKRVVDLLADFKMNQFQLYIEGFSFAYPSFPEVWQQETPITGLELAELDRYCKERFIDLVPNQNSFGHMEQWLSRPEFKLLAECPEGYQRRHSDGSLGAWRAPGTLNPLNPESIKLMSRIYDDLLPNFTSDKFNVGCDETFELGQGKSAQTCKEQGTGRVYLDYLNLIAQLVHGRDKTMMFWGDIIVNHPELVPEIPDQSIALLWGYEADFPFEEQCELFAAAKLPYYICPGTSGWNSVLGRVDNMRENIQRAAQIGQRYGASGYLITDWGDGGHWQSLPVGYPGLVYGAAASWNVGEAEVDLATCLNQFVFRDRAEVMGQLMIEAGNYYRQEEVVRFNSTQIDRVLKSDLYDADCLGGMKEESIDRIIALTEEFQNRLQRHQMMCDDAPIIERELKNGLQLVRHGCYLAKTKYLLFADTGNEKGSQSTTLRHRLEQLVEDLDTTVHHFELAWLKRNRLGGLHRSTAKLRNLRDEYQKELESLSGDS